MRVALIVLALAVYLVVPFDLVPDFLGPLGWVDDFFAVLLSVWALYRRWEGSAEPPAARAEEGAAEFDPHVVLGVPRGATPDEIRKAYRERMTEYHPDKVAHLGPELKELAHRKAQDIQKAYRMLVEE